MESEIESTLSGGKITPVDEGRMLWQNTILIVHALSMEDTLRPCPEYADVHLLTEAVAAIFPRHLKARHGYVYQVASRDRIGRFELPGMVKKMWREATIYFNSKDKIEPKLVFLRPVPYSWLLHPESDTIIDVIPIGGEPFVDMPVRHAPHSDRSPYNIDPAFELLKGKLPTKEQVSEMKSKMEALLKDKNKGDISRAFYWPI